MATFSSYSALRTAILDKIQTHVEGEPFTMTAGIADKTIRLHSVSEAMDWIKKSYELEALSSPVKIAYGRHRRW